MKIPKLFQQKHKIVKKKKIVPTLPHFFQPLTNFYLSCLTMKKNLSHMFTKCFEIFQVDLKFFTPKLILCSFVCDRYQRLQTDTPIT